MGTVEPRGIVSRRQAPQPSVMKYLILCQSTFTSGGAINADDRRKRYKKHRRDHTVVRQCGQPLSYWLSIGENLPAMCDRFDSCGVTSDALRAGTVSGFDHRNTRGNPVSCRGHTANAAAVAPVDEISFLPTVLSAARGCSTQHLLDPMRKCLLRLRSLQKGSTRSSRKRTRRG